jgi:hypothetical protein
MISTVFALRPVLRRKKNIIRCAIFMEGAYQGIELKEIVRSARKDEFPLLG